MPQRGSERGGGLPPLKTRPSLNDIVKILARSRCRPTPEARPSLALLSLSPPTVVIDHVRQEKTPCLDVVIGYPSFSPPCLSLSLCLCGAAILNPEATLMLQFRASYDLFLMPPPPPPPSAASGSSAVNFPFLPFAVCICLPHSL